MPVSYCRLLRWLQGACAIANDVWTCSRTLFEGRCLANHTQDLKVGQFCVFCGPCTSTCTTMVVSTHVHTTCPLGYQKLRVAAAATGSKGNPCTNVPVQCPVACRKWMCTYVIAAKMHSAHPQCGTPVFVLSTAERAAVLNLRQPKKKVHKDMAFVAPLPVTMVPSSPAAGDPSASSSSNSLGSSSSSGSSGSSSRNSGSSSSSGTSGPCSASEYCPSKPMLDTGHLQVALRHPLEPGRLHLGRGGALWLSVLREHP